MKIAIISDIHGNYPALSAVIEDANRNEVDKFIFAGDYIFDLPYSNEVTEIIKKIKNASVICGNKEGYLKGLSLENQNSWNIDQMGAIHQTFRELKPENISYLTKLEETCVVPLPFHGNVYVTHFIKAFLGGSKKMGCSSSKFKKDMEEHMFSHEQFLVNVEHFLKEKSTREVIADIDASVIVFGHSHLQWYGYCDDKLIINPGSCGQPLDFNVNASYTILTDSQLGLMVEEKRVPYDVEATINYSKTSEVYKSGKIWCDLVFSALRTGRDDFSDFFTLAKSLASERNETGNFFSNEIWNLASEKFFRRKDCSE